jgi:hypothetical protein
MIGSPSLTISLFYFHHKCVSPLGPFYSLLERRTWHCASEGRAVAGARWGTIAHCVLNAFVPQIGLQRPGIVAGIGQRIATGMPKHVGMNAEFEAGSTPARSTILAKPAVLNGAPLSDRKTNSDCGASRRNRRRARSSAPASGCVAGVPCFTRRT